MNIVTKADIAKFKKLLKTGLESGRNKNMTVYSNTSFDKDKDEYYISLEFKFYADSDVINEKFN